ncbi:YceI family protein [candidate division KSB1 bacterium]
MKKIVIFLLMFALISPVSYIMASDFTVKEGNVSYKVKSKTFGLFSDNIEGINDKLSGNIIVADGKISGKLIIMVTGFESGNSRRDRDVAKILKYEEYPDITFEIAEINEEILKEALEREKGSVSIKGKLTAAGVSKVYDIIIKYLHINENEVKLTTEISAKFSDFGIKPPSFGKVIKKTPDKLTLTGEIVFRNE